MIDDRADILLVEDNPNDLELTLYALRKKHLVKEIHIARDGEEAIKYLFEEDRTETKTLRQPPKMILLDLKLPKIGGIEVLRCIKGNPTTKAIPVVVLTSSKEEQDLLETYNLGVNSYLVKPVNFVEFEEIIEVLLEYWLVINKSPQG